MRKRMQWLALFSALLLIVASCGGGGETGADGQPAGPPQHGGSLTVLEDAAFAGGWPSGLDPATNTTGGANISQMHSIYGGLFLLRADDDGSNARVVPHQAEGYELLDGGRTVTITIREGIEFTDGTPMDAEAVAFNFRRSLESTCTCAPPWELSEKGITVEDERTVALHFTEPYAAVISAFPVSNVNWIASPTALEKLGEDQFKIKPVGAGPFTVVSNKLSSELVLKRNPNYFKEGRPYLDRLTFKSIGGDQPAYQALQAGQGDAYEGLSTTPLLEQAENNPQVNVAIQPATSPYVIQLNTAAKPFDDKRAREAIYYATDFGAISEGLFGGKYPPSQTFTGPGGLFHEPKVEGYRTHDLQRAKQLVKDLGGLDVTLGTLGAYVAEQVMTALQTQWKKAGINVKIEKYELNRLVQKFNGGEWQAMLQTAGAWDPASGVGVIFRFGSDSPFTGVHDPKLDQLLADAQATVDEDERAKLYGEAGKLISDEAYAPFGLAFAPANLAVDGVYAPGLTTKIPPIVVNSGVIWEDAWTSNQ